MKTENKKLLIELEKAGFKLHQIKPDYDGLTIEINKAYDKNITTAAKNAINAAGVSAIVIEKVLLFENLYKKLQIRFI